MPQAGHLPARSGLDRSVPRFPRRLGRIRSQGGRHVAFLPGLPRSQRHHAALSRTTAPRRPARRRDPRCPLFLEGGLSQRLLAVPSPPGGPVQDVLPRARRPIRISGRRLRPARHVVASHAVHALHFRPPRLVIRFLWPGRARPRPRPADARALRAGVLRRHPHLLQDP